MLTYVVNWDEFAEELGKGIKIDNVNIDTSGVESILTTYFPEIIDLLKDIRDELYKMRTKYENYNQKIKGFYNRTINKEKNIIEWIPEKHTFLTDVSFSHSNIEGIDDYFNLSVEKDNVELIFQQIYLKDSLQHKHFNKFFPVPAGMKIKLTHFNPSLTEKCVWYDLEYLEHK